MLGHFGLNFRIQRALFSLRNIFTWQKALWYSSLGGSSLGSLVFAEWLWVLQRFLVIGKQSSSEDKKRSVSESEPRIHEIVNYFLYRMSRLNRVQHCVLIHRDVWFSLFISFSIWFWSSIICHCNIFKHCIIGECALVVCVSCKSAKRNCFQFITGILCGLQMDFFRVLFTLFHQFRNSYHCDVFV